MATFSILAIIGSVLFLGNDVNAHTTKICASVEGTSVTFWAGTYHSANENNGALTGGVIISGGPCCNARYNFQTRQAGSTNPPGVDLNKFTCSQCPNWSGSFSSWQSVVVNGLQAGTWHVTSTSDHVIETPWPNCNFPDVTLEEEFFQPTVEPTDNPTPAPTADPTPAPTDDPTAAPTAQPTWYPPCANNPCNCNTEDPHCEICHANGCDECELGPNDETGYYWKLDYNYPCVGCQAIFGNECLHCQDFNGCGQCDEGYIRTHDTQEDLYYCVPAPPTPAPVNPTPNPTQSNVCSYQPQTCASNNCAGDGENPHCSQQNTWGCSSCNNGYFMVNHQTPCVPCSALDGCATCADWNGCTSCNAGYTWEWNNACNLGMCA